MELIRGLHNLRPSHRGCVATIGNFDGVHLAHQCILDQVKAKANELGLASLVMTFEPQPREFFAQGDVPPRISQFRDKLKLLQSQGVDRVLCLSFNQRFRALSADQFIQQVLIDGIGVRYLVVGDDFRYGCDRQGDFGLLQRAGLRHHYTVVNTETLTLVGERISSTRIREALTAGDFPLAQTLLGHPFSMTGRVGHGRKLGRQIGVPTANVHIRMVLPVLSGVFAVTVTTEGKDENPLNGVQGVANIGTRPTVDGTRPILEVHLLNFSGDLYGKRLEVTFHQKLRNERKFDNIELLKQQIQQDIQDAHRYFA